MYLTTLAYYCDHGSDADCCLPAGASGPGNGWEVARAKLGKTRVAATAARSAVLATAAVMRCTAELRERDPAAFARLPLFVASATGLGFTAQGARALCDARQQYASLEAVLFSGEGPHVVDSLRYANPMLAGVVAQFAGLRGENRALTGRAAGLFALLQAQRYLDSGRAAQVVVACGESSIEWSSTQPARSSSALREFGSAFLLEHSASTALARLHLTPQPHLEASRPRFTHFEAVNAPANLCSSLERPANAASSFVETDAYGRRWHYGIEPTARVP